MSQAKRKWLEFDYKSYVLVTSPSAMETADDCMRKWWFQKVMRLKEPQKHFTKLGDVFHEVCERWLEADDNGRDPATGKEVDVFPKGWADVLDFGQEAVVRSIFKAFVDEGVLRRTPGRHIEKSFQIPVIPGASIMGFADVWTPLGIEDHKTSKARKWLKNRDALSECIQMMAYAAAWCFEEMGKGVKPEDLKLELRHNQGITDPEDLYVRPTSKDITGADVAAFWDGKIIPLVKRMLYWKQADLPPESWAKVDGPKPRKGICKKYGGCPFQGICGRTESVDAYKSRISLHTETEEATKAQETHMSEDLLAKLAAKKKARSGAGVTTNTAPAAADETESVESAVESQRTTTPAPESANADTKTVENATADGLPDVAPWAQPGCKACGGSGISTAGEACMPCGINAKKVGVMTSDFKIAAIEGAVEIRRGDVLLSVVPVAVEVKAADNTKPTKSEAAPVEQTPTPKQTEKAADKPAGKGRPKKGFTMVYGVVKRGKGTFIDLQQVLLKEGDELAEAWDAKSYYAIDVFKRREALAQKAKIIAEEFGPSIVMVTTDQRDLLDFAAALEPFAATVFVGGMR